MSAPKLTPTGEKLFALLTEQQQEHAVILIEPSGRIVGWFPGAEATFGYTAEEAIGQPTSVLFTPEDVALGLDSHELETAAKHGKAEDDRWQLRKDGGRIWANGMMTSLHDESGRLVGFGKVLRDRTDLKARLDALENRAASLAEGDQRRTVFLDTLAHELGNTFYSLGLMVELMRRTVAASPDVEQLLPILERQSEVMKRLLADLGGVVRAGTDRLELEVGRVNLNDIVRQATETCRPRAAERRQELLALIPPGALEVEGDNVRLHQVFVNLISNSVKYTPEGGHIAVKMTAEGPEAVVKVEDTGVGIAPDMLPRIFELFTRETNHGDAPAGWGVGLWLVRNLVTLHGGTVAVRSDGKGKGSEFVVRLPLCGTIAAGYDGPVDTGEPAQSHRQDDIPAKSHG